MSFAYQDDAERIILRAPKNAEITIPKQAWEIYGNSKDDNAFINARSILLNVIFPIGCSLKKISKYSFYSCSLLSKIDLSNCKNLEEISEGAFSNCESVSSVTLPNSVLKTLGPTCFASILNTNSFYIPPTIESIGHSAFSLCNMTTFTFDPEIKVTSLPMWVFYGCQNLREITIPKNLVSISNDFDDKCKSLVNIWVAKENTAYYSEEGVVYLKDKEKKSIG